MVKFSRYFVIIVASLFSSSQTWAAEDQSEVSLYDASRAAVAYIDADDELTIYLWDGKPVAYLEPDTGNEFHVYGFSGKHLGWFVDGVIRDHEGNASCVLKQLLSSPQFEPFKAFKQFKPFKGFKEFAPFRPFLSTSWSTMPCTLLLASGS